MAGVVSNSGSTTLENVRLYLPDAVEAELHVGGDVRSLREEFGPIPVLVLGILPPGANVTVVAWTEVLSPFSTQEIRLAHRDGYGDVSVQVPTGRLGERIGPIGFGLFGGLIALLATLLIMESVSRRDATPRCRTGELDAEPRPDLPILPRVCKTAVFSLQWFIPAATA